MILDTIRGPLDDSLLDKQTVIEPVEAGTRECTVYIYEGEVVRQDITIHVSEAALASLGNGGI